MSGSPLLSLWSDGISLLSSLPASPVLWTLAATLVLAFLFHRTQWLILLWVLVLVEASPVSHSGFWPETALWLAWLQALWLVDKPLRRPRTGLIALALTALALSPLLPLPTAWLEPTLPGLTRLPRLDMAPLTLTLAFIAALSLLFLYYLRPTASWPWHAAGLLLTLGLSGRPEADPVLRLALPLVIAAAMLTDAYSVAYRDALTGIPNRRALTQMMKTLGRRYAIAMADVDHFKSFNDTWGHETGDQVLKLVAGLLSRHSLPVRVFRYGGEEFTLVFRGMTRHEATPILDELRERIAHYPLTVRDTGRPRSGKRGKRQRGRGRAATKQVRITASFGVTDAYSARTPDEAIRIADKALYKAKQAGRNCVRGQ